MLMHVRQAKRKRYDLQRLITHTTNRYSIRVNGIRSKGSTLQDRVRLLIPGQSSVFTAGPRRVGDHARTRLVWLIIPTQNAHYRRDWSAFPFLRCIRSIFHGAALLLRGIGENIHGRCCAEAQA